MKNELSNVDFQGTSGKIKFDVNGDTIKPVVLKTVKNGEYVALN
ncbi:MAG: hypothetical protein QF486_06610 [Candidatus Woesearchaeota archaeon]|nr:hypothetical protein [Candidatus Woesearchaeota archaeon]MDP7181943.1 hypothetical protein [Candidatus Woesearchaeota archaeon]MDP7199258.1 hypothetical protein [Candidatus Woesearchaeota archaeon]MDP7467935.1 hypothetical protein [Candidatus Woesearchaeota archaeon]MDP7647861.1 hypothetical protein [Candidatus Woesearchaeota archaeon]